MVIINILHITGEVMSDPVVTAETLVDTQTGNSFTIKKCSIRLRWKNFNSTTFFSLIANFMGKRCELVMNKCKKGSIMTVIGHIQQAKIDGVMENVVKVIKFYSS